MQLDNVLGKGLKVKNKMQCRPIATRNRRELPAYWHLRADFIARAFAGIKKFRFVQRRPDRASAAVRRLACTGIRSALAFRTPGQAHHRGRAPARAPPARGAKPMSSAHTKYALMNTLHSLQSEPRNILTRMRNSSTRTQLQGMINLCSSELQVVIPRSVRNIECSPCEASRWGACVHDDVFSNGDEIFG